MITYCAAECAEHTGRCSCHCPFACAGPCSRHCLVCAARVDSHCLCRLCCEDTMSKRVSEQESEREQGKKSVCERVRAKQRARGKASAREPSSRSCSHHVTTFASLAGASARLAKIFNTLQRTTTHAWYTLQQATHNYEASIDA